MQCYIMYNNRILLTHLSSQVHYRIAYLEVEFLLPSKHTVPSLK
jgi:hypothetical protein